MNCPVTGILLIPGRLFIISLLTPNSFIVHERAQFCSSLLLFFDRKQPNGFSLFSQEKLCGARHIDIVIIRSFDSVLQTATGICNCHIIYYPQVAPHKEQVPLTSSSMLGAMGLHTIAGMQDMTTKQDSLVLWKAGQTARCWTRAEFLQGL